MSEMYTKLDMKKAFEAGEKHNYAKSSEGSAWSERLYPSFGIWLRKYSKKQLNIEKQ
jgi:hypothetical protein